MLLEAPSEAPLVCECVSGCDCTCPFDQGSLFLLWPYSHCLLCSGSPHNFSCWLPASASAPSCHSQKGSSRRRGGPCPPVLQSFSDSHKPQGKIHVEFKAFYRLALGYLLVLSLTWPGLARPDHSSFHSCHRPAFLASV